MLFWLTTLAFIEKKDPSRSYTWTIAVVTFGICCYLPRWGREMTSWKRWLSIFQGTLICAFWTLLLPMLGLYPGKTVDKELKAQATSLWKKSLNMVEEAIQNPKDEEAKKRIAADFTAAWKALGSTGVSWKKYSYARTWIGLVKPSRPLPLLRAKELLDKHMYALLQTCDFASRLLHRTLSSPVDADSYGAARVCLHDAGNQVLPAIEALCLEDPSVEVRQQARAGLQAALDHLEAAVTKKEKKGGWLGTLGPVQQSALAEVLLAMVGIVRHLEIAHSADNNRSSEERSGELTKKCDALLKVLREADEKAATIM